MIGVALFGGMKARPAAGTGSVCSFAMLHAKWAQNASVSIVTAAARRPTPLQRSGTASTSRLSM